MQIAFCGGGNIGNRHNSDDEIGTALSPLLAVERTCFRFTIGSS
jgi:hypothetical protein